METPRPRAWATRAPNLSSAPSIGRLPVSLLVFTLKGSLLVFKWRVPWITGFRACQNRAAAIHTYRSCPWLWELKGYIPSNAVKVEDATEAWHPSSLVTPRRRAGVDLRGALSNPKALLGKLRLPIGRLLDLLWSQLHLLENSAKLTCTCVQISHKT